MHLLFYDAVSVAVIAAAALDVKAEAPFFIAAHF
jgi:hypothetical protein